MEPAECEVVKEEVPLPDMLLKVIIIGDAGVGKSCILYRATSGEFKETYEVTIGAGFSAFTVRYHGKTIKLQIWDTAGQENFKSMIRVFYKGAHAAVLVYDVTRQETFDKLEEWLMEVKENANTDVKLALVGNQKDRAERREVSTDTGQAFAQKHGMSAFLETSAKTGEGVIELFISIVKLLYDDTVVDSSSGKKLHNEKKTKSDQCC